MGTRVFVGGLSHRVKERDLEKFFKRYGKIKEISMKNGFAFVQFEDYRDAEDAVYELNGQELLGERVSVERARGTPRGSDQWRGNNRGYGPPRGRSRDTYKPPTRTKHRVIVENLSSRVSWQDLKDYMRQAGEVTYADAHKQRLNKGAVEFASYADMKNAIEKLDDTELNGRRLHIYEDKSQSSGRSPSSSNSSRSRSRSGSRSVDRHTKTKSSKRSKSRSTSKSTRGSKSPFRSKSEKQTSPRVRSGRYAGIPTQRENKSRH